MKQNNELAATIYEMVTESTGTHILDSGGSNGRHWQRNQQKSIEDFLSAPEATLGFFEWSRSGETVIEPEVTVSVFAKMLQVLELDDVCREFNELPVDDWDSEIYGVSTEGFDWLMSRGAERNNGEYSGTFNTYNDESFLSQVLQGEFLEIDGENYVLLQVHQGADVRGGYTDAKLFTFNKFLEPYELLRCDANFGVEKDDGHMSMTIDPWQSFDHNGHPIDDDYLREFYAAATKAHKGEGEVIVEGYIF